MTAESAKKCPHCGGKVEAVGVGRSANTERCTSCGREPGQIVSRAAGSPQPAPVASGPCPVDGCPGTRLATGNCACCVRRAAWLESHMPARQCEICDGPIPAKARKNTKLCAACAPVKQRVQSVEQKRAK